MFISVTNADSSFDQTPPRLLDLRGLKCPLPVLRAQKAARTMAPGAVLVLLCTDPLAAIDIPHFAQENGHALEGQDNDAGLLTFRIRLCAKHAAGLPQLQP